MPSTAMRGHRGSLSALTRPTGTQLAPDRHPTGTIRDNDQIAA
jgi:hypothetical protein